MKNEATKSASRKCNTHSQILRQFSFEIQDNIHIAFAYASHRF